MKKTVELLREMQYGRLFLTRRLRFLIEEGLNPSLFPLSVLHDIRGGSSVPTREPTSRVHHHDNISEAVAAGEIKSTGKSVSIDDVLNRIDKALEANDEN